MRMVLVSALCWSAGCRTSKRCSCEVTDGAFGALVTAQGSDALPTVRKHAVRDACAALCEKKHDPGEACAVRCVVDVETGKIGARIRCGE